MQVTLKRVVVTGLGAITPLGNSTNEFWQALLNGVSGAAPITKFDATNFKTRFACEVKNYDSDAIFGRKESRKLDLFAQYGISAADEAIADAGLDRPEIDKNRIGVIFSSGIGGISTFQEQLFDYWTQKQSNSLNARFNPFFIPKMILDIADGHISIKYGFRGLHFAVV